MDAPTIDYLIVDAFSDEPFCGNPAGVVLGASELAEEQMQQLAREINLSETAFVSQKSPDRYSVRFFTPAQEVNFCGHATVALASALVWAGEIELLDGPRKITMAVKAGDLEVELRPHDICGVEVCMTQAPPQFGDFGYHLELLAGTLGLDSYFIPTNQPLGLAYTGLWALVVPVTTREAIDMARPDFASLSDLNQKIGCSSTHLYTQDGPNCLYCRDFSPAVGVPEDPVTGSAMGAMAALLAREGAIALSPPVTRVYGTQGDTMGRPGKVQMEVIHGDDGLEAIRVIGLAVPAAEGRIRIP